MKSIVPIIAILGLAISLPAVAQQSFGLAQVRNQLPFDQLFLGLIPTTAQTLAPGKLQCSISATWSNTFIMSDSIRNWADVYWPTGRHHLRRADLRQIEAASPNSDLYFYDGEVIRWNLHMHYGLTNTIELTVNTSIHSRGGGFADSSIESFHNVLNIGNADRERFIQNHFAVFLKMDGHEFFHDGAPANTVMGDTSFSLKIRSPHLWHGWLAAGAIAVKAPTGNSHLFGGSGHWDEQLAGYVSRALGPGWFHVNAAYTILGNIDALPSLDTTNLWTFVAGYEIWSPHHTINWVLQTEISSSPFADTTSADLGDPSYLLLLGARIPTSPNAHLSFAVMENIFQFDDSTDIALHAGYTVTF